MCIVAGGEGAYGVARLETSFAIWTVSQPVSDETMGGRGGTYDIDTSIPRNSNNAVEGTQVDSYDRHGWYLMAGLCWAVISLWRGRGVFGGGYKGIFEGGSWWLE